MKTHTPGPWRVDHSGPCYIGIIDENERTIAFCALQSEDAGEDESNSCLIASAPDLLASLIELESMVAEMLPKHGPCGWGELALNQAREAIAKAKGNE